MLHGKPGYHTSPLNNVNNTSSEVTLKPSRQQRCKARGDLPQRSTPTLCDTAIRHVCNQYGSSPRPPGSARARCGIAQRAQRASEPTEGAHGTSSVCMINVRGLRAVGQGSLASSPCPRNARARYIADLEHKAGNRRPICRRPSAGMSRARWPRPMRCLARCRAAQRRRRRPASRVSLPGVPPCLRSA